MIVVIVVELQKLIQSVAAGRLNWRGKPYSVHMSTVKRFMKHHELRLRKTSPIDFKRAQSATVKALDAWVKLIDDYVRELY